MKNRIAFFGTPDFSTLVLEELVASGYTPVVIVTAPDKPAGRGLKMTASPVKKYALAHGIEVLQPIKIDEEFIALLKDKGLDLIVVAAYGKLLPASLLSLPKHSSLNIHPSLLPRYRGTSPVESQIINDETNIGVTVIQMDEQMDHGPIVAQEQILIPDWPITRQALNDLLWKKGGALLVACIEEWIADKIRSKPQDHTTATYTKKIQKSDGLIDLSQPGREKFLQYLAYFGWPGSFFFIQRHNIEIRVKIIAAHFADEEFIIDEVIPESGKQMTWEQFSTWKR